MYSQNLDKLSPEALDLIAVVMLQENFVWPHSYMIEVRLDDPVHHLLHGGEGLGVHAGGGSRHYAKYLGHPDWAVVHLEDEDVRDWNWEQMAQRAKEKWLDVVPD